MTEENKAAEEQQNNPQIPRVQIGPHALGGIQVIARSPEGEILSTRIELPEAAMLHVHLGALLSMAFQEIYMNAAQAAATQNKIVVPGGKNG